MATGKEILNYYKNLNIRKAIHSSLEKTTEDALNFQAQQMFEGKRATRGDINPQYSSITVEIKRSKGQVTDRVTLKDTGFFYTSLYFVIKPETFEFKSSDIKRFEITKKYGETIFGLNQYFRKEYVGVLKFVFIDEIKKQ